VVRVHATQREHAEKQRRLNKSWRPGERPPPSGRTQNPKRWRLFSWGKPIFIIIGLPQAFLSYVFHFLVVLSTFVDFSETTPSSSKPLALYLLAVSV
jgi:hypothetical protein